MSGSADLMMRVLAEMNIPAFRFNFDLFDKYKFHWIGGEFRIEDPLGRVCASENVTEMVFYKGLFAVDEACQYDQDHEETRWIKSWLNNLYFCFVRYGMDRDIIRLFHPDEVTYTKVWQMNVAKDFFKVPDFMLHFGFAPASKDVIVKNLTGRHFTSGTAMMASVVDRAQLDPKYPWFTQDIAPGSHDATVLFVNGKVHPFVFATPRGDLTDWRITQGTDANRWRVWEAGDAFEEKIRSYMDALGLKYGRLDFIVGCGEPQFLEVNPTGQFGWLDEEDGLPLHREVVNAILDPSSSVRI